MKTLNKRNCVLAIAVASQGMLAAAEDFAIEEVIVTAQKRAESLQDVPVSVSALSSRDLEGLKLRSTTEFAAQIPNVHIQSLGGDSQPVISVRGVSMSDYSQNQSGPVAVYVDEVYKGASPLISMQMFDLERVEVLRGPQGTLYGKNSTGGAVNFITKSPTMDEEEGYLRVGLGNYSRIETQGAYQTPLIEDTLAVRAAFTYVEADGYVENKLAGEDDLNEIEEFAVRITTLYTPTDELNITLRAHKSQSEPRTYGVLGEELSPAGIGFTGYTRDGLDYYETEVDHVRDKKINAEGLAVTVDWDINSDYTVTSITSFDRGVYNSEEDSDGSPLDILTVAFDSDATQYTQDLRLTSDFDSSFNYILGLYYAKEEINYKNTFRFFNDAIFAGDCVTDFVTGCIYDNELDQERESYAVYFHSTYDLNDQLTLTFGLRYTDDETSVANYRADLSASDGTALGAIFAPQPEQTIKDDDVSGKIGLDYQLSGDVLVYLNYSEGYRASSFNGQALFSASEITSVDPEEIDSWEMGVKSQIFDGRVQVNAAIFHYDYTNQQFLEVQPDLTQLLVNAGESTIKGAEVEIQARVTEAFTVNAGVGYIDGEYDELSLSGVDLSGNNLTGSPELSFNVALDYEFEPTSIGTFALRMDTSFSDEIYFDAANTDRIKQDSYWLSNLRLGLDSPDDSYSVAVWVKNLEDKHYTAWAAALDDFNYDFKQRGMPRTYGVEATWRF